MKKTGKTAVERTPRRAKLLVDVGTHEELLKLYLDLTLIHHGTAVQDALNAEFDSLSPVFRPIHKTKNGKVYVEEDKGDDPETWKTLVDGLAALDMTGVGIEMRGTFLWLSGDTKPYKEDFKRLGLKWASKKKAWYHESEDYAQRRYGSGTKTGIQVAAS